MQPPLCVILAHDDLGLAEAVIGSLPHDEVGGYLVAGLEHMDALTSRPGCRGHVTAYLDRAEPDTWKVIKQAASGQPLLAIGADDTGCAFLSRFSGDVASIPVAGAQTLGLLRDKWSFQDICGELGLPTPPALLLADKHRIPIDRLLARWGKLVIKPTNRRASQGLAILDTAAAFQREVLDSPAYDFAPLMAQPFVEGWDAGVSFLALEGEILHMAVQAPQDGGIRFFEHAGLERAATVLAEATGFSGLANIDVRMRPDGGFDLLECNPRPWGSLGAATACGLNFIRAGIDLARVKSTDQPARLSSGAAPPLLARAA